MPEVTATGRRPWTTCPGLRVRCTMAGCVPRAFGRSRPVLDACWPAKRPGRISVMQPGRAEKRESRHDVLVDEGQRRDLLRRAEGEVRRPAGNTDGTHPRAERQRQLGLERSTAAELGLPYAECVDFG